VIFSEPLGKVFLFAYCKLLTVISL